MPLLGRLFGKKNRTSPRGETLDDNIAPSPTVESATTASDSNHSSNTVSSYVTPDISIPSHPNARNLLHLELQGEQGSTTSHSTAASSGGGSRLRLFGRKKASTAGSEVLSSTASYVSSSSEVRSPQRSPHPRLFDPEIDPSDLRRLRPPPSRSAIFAAYADPGSSLSTRSLPENSSHRSNSFLPPSPPPAPPQKRPSLFSWAKPSSKSLLKDVDRSIKAPNESSNSPANNSFNLKSFRHVGPGSPPLLPNDGFNTPPLPRPRGTSMHSDSSQRISVAAFREMQARRSQNGSPVPSPPESSSPTALPTPRTMTADGSRTGHGPRTSRSSAALLQSGHEKRPSIAMASTTDDDDSQSEADSDDDSVYNDNSRQRPGRAKAKSDMGHGSTVVESSFKRSNVVSKVSRVSRSHIGHSSLSPRPLTCFEVQDESKRPEIPPRPQSSLSVYGKRGANASTSSLDKSPVRHKRAPSTSSNLTLSTARKVTPPKAATNQPTSIGKANIHPPPRDSDSDSEDDAPLASLIAPKRPGSAMSSLSNPQSTSSQVHAANRSAKPLIDVNEVIASKPTSGSLPPSDAAFTQGPTLLSSAKSMTNINGTSSRVSSPKFADDSRPLTRKVPPVKFVSPPSSPAKEMKEFISPSYEERANLDQKFELSVSPFPILPGRRETSPEQHKRDPLSDRLSRAVRKSLTNPPDSETRSPPPPIPKPLPRDTSPLSDRLSRAVRKSLTKPPDSEARSSPPPIPKPLPRDTSPLSGAMTSESLQAPEPSEGPRIVQPSSKDYSPPDEDLAELLGAAGIKLISRSGESTEESSESDYFHEEEKQENKEDRIAPIPIKHRTPPPAFAVTSRPTALRQQQQNAAASLKSSLTPGQVKQKNPTPTQSTDYPGVRRRSSTLIPSLSSSPFSSNSTAVKQSFPSSAPATDIPNASSNGQPGGTASASALGRVIRTTSVRPTSDVRPRSYTIVNGAPPSSQMSRPFNVPDRHLANVRGNSPSSSTGDSNSSRAPHTPQDGSELGIQEGKDKKKVSTPTKYEEWSGGATGLGIKKQAAHVKRRSVSFEDDIRDLNTRQSRSHIREAARIDPVGVGIHVREGARAAPDNGDSSNEEREKEKDDRRKERRRKEAKAAIELGNVIHGPPPVLDDDGDAMPANPAMNTRVSAFNPMMGIGNHMAMPMGFLPSPGSAGWAPNMTQAMVSPAQFIIPPPSNPSLMAAHQQAMMVAKHAYQMAVAQQAMAAAGEEWERGSTLGGFGSGGSVYGGSNAPSMMNAPLGMMPAMQGNLAAAMWSGTPSPYSGMGSVPRFGSYLTPGEVPFSSSRSDYGGAGGRNFGNWGSSKSTYGESFGPSSDMHARRLAAQQQAMPSRNAARDSVQFPPVPPIPASRHLNGRGSPEPRGPPRQRTTSQPATPTRSAFARKAPPPSSWRPSGG